MGLRTAADVQAEYTAVRAAYLRALDAESYTISTGGGQRSAARAKTVELREQMLALEKEYNRLTGSGMKIVGVIPVI